MNDTVKNVFKLINGSHLVKFVPTVTIKMVKKLYPFVNGLVVTVVLTTTVTSMRLLTLKIKV